MVERERMESLTRASLNGYAEVKQDGTNRVWAWAEPSSLPKTAWACSLRETAPPVPPLLNDWGYALYRKR